MSSPTGYSETDSDVHSEDPAPSERLDPRVQQAWGSETQLLGDEVLGGHESFFDRETTPTLAEASITKKKDRIVSDW